MTRRDLLGSASLLLLARSLAAAEQQSPPPPAGPGGPAPAPAWQRFELGRRLRLCEAAWDGAGAEGRRRAVAPLQRTIVAFFGGSPLAAAEGLDRARFAMRGATPPGAATLWAESLVVRPARRLLDPGSERTLRVTVDRLYGTLAAPTGGSRPAAVAAYLEAGDGTRVPGSVVSQNAAPSLPLSLEVPLESAAEGEHRLVVEIGSGGNVLAETRVTLSAVRDAGARVAQVQAAAEKADAKTTPGATLVDHAAKLGALAGGGVLEAETPAGALLAEAEALAAGRGFPGRKPGQAWRTLASPAARVPVRLYAPTAVLDGKPLPVVLALHGAGGSENLFFEGYGQGRIAGLCERRGWLAVSPRGGVGALGLDGLLDALGALYPIDRKRVYAVGHSLGAMQTVALAGAQPDRLAAVAALAGGGAGTLPAPAAVKGVPFFVAAGAQDFALGATRALRDRLKTGAVTRLEYREYGDVEHLLVVQAALPDVFAFFDEVDRPPGHGRSPE